MDLKTRLKNSYIFGQSFFTVKRPAQPEEVSPTGNLPLSRWQFRLTRAYHNRVATTPSQYGRLRKFIRQHLNEVLNQPANRQKA